MGGFKSVGRGLAGVATLGASELAQRNPYGGGPLGRGLAGITTGGLSEFAQRNPWGVPVNNPLALKGDFWNQRLLGSNPDGTAAGISGPFSLDPAQLASDKSEITGLGEKQYADTLGAIDTNSQAQTQRAKDLFAQTLPDIAENAQAAHLYDSTGYGQEVARQQANIASQVASDVANQKFQALSGRQGFETGALQRGQSLEDFINQANVAKTIGAQMAPAPPSGKQNFGTVAQGVGALSPFAKLGKAASTGTPAGLI